MCEEIYNLLSELRVKIELPITLFEDNRGAISNTMDGTKLKLKHIQIKTLKVKEQIRRDLVKIKYIDTVNEYADYLTKAPPGKGFDEIRQQLGLVVIRHGGV